MLLRRSLLVLSLLAVSFARAAAQGDAAAAGSPPAPAAAAHPMAEFARLVGGEWRVTFASGATAAHAWHWGPGQHSLRRMTYGNADADASSADNPWAGEVLYWHPGHGQVRLLSLHEDIPGVGRGVAEGTIRFEGETTEATIELDQPRGRRKLGQRQIFDGPDRYHEELLEDAGAGLQPLAAWDFQRDKDRSAPPAPPIASPAGLELPGHWKPFEALVGGAWETVRDPAIGGGLGIASTHEWVPSLEVVVVRVHTRDGHPEGSPRLEAYIYRDVRTDAVRCLALSETGGVYEGQATALDGGAVQIDLQAYEGDRTVPLVARFEIEADGRLRTRAWSVEGATRTLTFDVRQERREPPRH